MVIHDDGGVTLDANPHNTAVSLYTGRVFDVANPESWDFDIKDIAHALSNVCRFAGHVNFYSVAEHSIRVARLLKDWGCTPEIQLAGLLHDASEAYLLDIPRPWKGLVEVNGQSYYDTENAINDVLMRKFGVWTDWFMNGDGVIKEADVAIYEEERAARPNCSVMPGASPSAMETMFLWQYQTLTEAI